MLQDLFELIVVDFVWLAIKGMFRKAPTSAIRRIKVGAWFCIGIAGVLISAALVFPQAIQLNVIVVASITALFCAVGFGFWASLEHIRLMPTISQ